MAWTRGRRVLPVKGQRVNILDVAGRLFLPRLPDSAAGMAAATAHERAQLGTNKTLSTNAGGGPDLAYGWRWATPGPANPRYRETCLWGVPGSPSLAPLDEVSVRSTGLVTQ